MPIELREETFYTAQEVADMLKVDVRTIRRMLKDGRLKASRLGNRVYVTDGSLMEALSTPANASKPRLSPEAKEKMRQVAAKAFAALQAKREAKRAQASEYRYRIIYGETGNESGHIEDLPGGSTDSEAQSMLTKRMKKYGSPGAAWGRVEYHHIDETPDAWRTLEG